MFWTAVSLAICTAIFIFSSQNGDSSGFISEGLTRKIFPAIVSDEAIYAIEKVIRKLAHYGIYFSLGVSVLYAYICGVRAYSDNNPSKVKRIFIPLSLCFVYSLTDELHQMFVPDRNGVFTDCLLDTAGALSGIAFGMLIIAFLQKISKK